MLKLMQELDYTANYLYKQAEGLSAPESDVRPQFIGREYHQDNYIPPTSDFYMGPQKERPFTAEYQEPLRVLHRNDGRPDRMWDPVRNRTFSFEFDPKEPEFSWADTKFGLRNGNRDLGHLFSDRVNNNRYMLNSNIAGIPNGVLMDSKGGVYDPFFSQIGNVDDKGNFTRSIGPTQVPWRVAKRDQNGRPIQVWIPPEDTSVKGMPKDKRGNMFTFSNGQWYHGTKPTWAYAANPQLTKGLNARIDSGQGLLNTNTVDGPVQMDSKGNVYDSDYNLIGSVNEQGGYTPAATYGSPVIPWRVMQRNKEGRPTQIYVPANDPMSNGDSRGAVYTLGNRGQWYLGDKPGFMGLGKQDKINVGRKIDNRLNTGIGLLDTNIPDIPDGVMMDRRNGVYDANMQRIGTVDPSGKYVPVKAPTKPVKAGSYKKFHSLIDELDYTDKFIKKADTPTSVPDLSQISHSIPGTHKFELPSTPTSQSSTSPTYGPVIPPNPMSDEGNADRYRLWMQNPNKAAKPEYYSSPQFFKDREAAAAQRSQSNRLQQARGAVEVSPEATTLEPPVSAPSIPELRSPWLITRRNQQGRPLQMWNAANDRMFTRYNSDWTGHGWFTGDGNNLTDWSVPAKAKGDLATELDDAARGKYSLSAGLVPNGAYMDQFGNVYDENKHRLGIINSNGAQSLPGLHPISMPPEAAYMLPKGQQLLQVDDGQFAGQYIYDPKSPEFLRLYESDSSALANRLIQAHISESVNNGDDIPYRANLWYANAGALPTYKQNVKIRPNSNNEADGYTVFDSNNKPLGPLTGTDLEIFKWMQTSNNIRPAGVPALEFYTQNQVPAGATLDPNNPNEVIINGYSMATYDPIRRMYIPHPPVQINAHTQTEAAVPSTSGQPIQTNLNSDDIDESQVTSSATPSSDETTQATQPSTLPANLKPGDPVQNDNGEVVGYVNERGEVRSTPNGHRGEDGSSEVLENSNSYPYMGAIVYDPNGNPIGEVDEQGSIWNNGENIGTVGTDGVPRNANGATIGSLEQYNRVDDYEPTNPAITPPKKDLLADIKSGELWHNEDFLNGLKIGLPIMGALALAGYFIGGSKPGTLMPLLAGGLGAGALLGGLGGYYGWFGGEGNDAAAEEGTEETVPENETGNTTENGTDNTTEGAASNPEYSNKFVEYRLEHINDIQSMEELLEFSHTLNMMNLSPEDRYKANRLFNAKAEQLTAEKRKTDPNFSDPRLYRPVSEDDNTNHATENVGSFSRTEGTYAPGFWALAHMFEIQPDTVNNPEEAEALLTTMQKAEAQGRVEPGKTKQLAQKYLDSVRQQINSGRVSKQHLVRGGSEGIRYVGENTKGRPVWHVPTEALGYSTWQFPDGVNVYWDGKYYRSQDFGWDNVIPDFDKMLRDNRYLPQNAVDNNPIYARIAKTYGLQW